ncbi:histidine phosphatase family protein [Lactobacillaceae bacterium Melli_B3]
MTKINLYIVRHGKTYFNVYRKMQGWSNSPLTDAGIENAQNIAERLKNTSFDAAYCSDTTRAIDTLKIILAQNKPSSIKPTISKFFRDGFYGSFEGENIDRTMYVAGAPHGLNSFKDIVDQHSVAKMRDLIKEADPFHQAENNQEFWHRFNKGIDLIRNDPSVHDGSNVLLIGHGVGLLNFVEHFSDQDYDLTKRPANGSLTKALINDDSVEITDYDLT